MVTNHDIDLSIFFGYDQVSAGNPEIFIGMAQVNDLDGFFNNGIFGNINKYPILGKKSIQGNQSVG